MISLPECYAEWPLPDLKFSHNPPSSPSVTPVIFVILDCPAARNAFTDNMACSLVTAFDTLSRDPRVRCVALMGSDLQNKTFCAGMDLNAKHDLGASAEAYRDGGGRVAISIYNCSKPVVVALNGSAVGVGITMTLAANIRIVSEKAKVGFVFTRRGICMEGTSSYFLPRLIGGGRASHLLTAGGVHPAGHKLFDGLFSEVVAPEKVIPTAIAIAEEVARNTSTVSTRIMKDLIFRGPKSPEEAHLIESKLLYDFFRSRDFQEGINSFIEKRAPDFKALITEQADRPSTWPWWKFKDMKGKI